MGKVREGLGEMASPTELGQALAAIGLVRHAPSEADMARELQRRSLPGPARPAAGNTGQGLIRSTLTPAESADLRLHQLRPLSGVFRPPPS